MFTGRQADTLAAHMEVTNPLHLCI